MPGSEKVIPFKETAEEPGLYNSMNSVEGKPIIGIGSGNI